MSERKEGTPPTAEMSLWLQTQLKGMHYARVYEGLNAIRMNNLSITV